LLSGILKCDECNGSFIMADYYRYTCDGHPSRGASVCTNDLRVYRKLVEERCLEALRYELLTPESVERIIQKTIRLLQLQGAGHKPSLASRASFSRPSTLYPQALRPIPPGPAMPDAFLIQ